MFLEAGKHRRQSLYNGESQRRSKQERTRPRKKETEEGRKCVCYWVFGEWRAAVNSAKHARVLLATSGLMCLCWCSEILDWSDHGDEGNDENDQRFDLHHFILTSTSSITISWPSGHIIRYQEFSISLIACDITDADLTQKKQPMQMWVSSLFFHRY